MWVLLFLPFVGLLWVLFYNYNEPRLFGFPFFYWYQLAWVPVTALLTWAVYRVQGHSGGDSGGPGEAMSAPLPIPPTAAPGAPVGDRLGRFQGDRPGPVQGFLREAGSLGRTG